MPPQLYFFASIAFAFAAWGVLTLRYVWPRLRLLSWTEALRPILILHSFRFIGLAFLVTGVVSPDLPTGFAHHAAYGDIAAATLALLSLAMLQSKAGLPIAWVFNLWGSFDLLSAFYYAGKAGLIPGDLGAAYFIPTLLVPLMLITHALAFRVLLQHQKQSKNNERLQPAV